MMKTEYEYRAKHLVRCGSVMTPKKHIIFSNKTCHMPGLQYVVNKDTLSYYVVNLQDYTVVKY